MGSEVPGVLADPAGDVGRVVLEKDDPLFVGRLAEETGIKPGTLRMWERRYGRPKPERLPSGHRTLSILEDVDRRSDAGERVAILSFGSPDRRLTLVEATPPAAAA